MQRMDILRSLMSCKNIISGDSEILDLADIAMKTEGYLPRDLNLLLDRAIHASAVHHRDNSNTQGKHLSQVSLYCECKRHVYLKVCDVPQGCV